MSFYLNVEFFRLPTFFERCLCCLLIKIPSSSEFDGFSSVGLNEMMNERFSFDLNQRSGNSPAVLPCEKSLVFFFQSWFLNSFGARRVFFSSARLVPRLAIPATKQQKLICIQIDPNLSRKRRFCRSLSLSLSLDDGNVFVCLHFN